MEQEIFKDIPGYEGLYQISNLGNAKSLRNNKGKFVEKLLKHNKDKDGYLNIALYKNKKVKCCRIHRLICLTFLDNPENKPCVNHKNGIKYDNRLENLEWCTISENGLHSYRILGYKNHLQINHPYKGKFGKLSIVSKKINQYDLSGNFIKTWDCMMDVTRNLGISNKNISSCCRFKKKTAGGFIWRYFNG